MIEDEVDDELPPISVNSRLRKNVCLLTMPSADVLASQRAREEECERELKVLHESHATNETCVAQIVNSDSSGSEGETALAAAVDALRVYPDKIENNINSSTQIDNLEVIKRLLQLLPECDTLFLQEYYKVLQHGNCAAIKHITNEMLSGVESALVCEAEWEATIMLGCGAWLCAMSSARVLRGPRPCAALLALLWHADSAYPEALSQLAKLAAKSLCSARALLALSDMAAAGPSQFTSELRRHTLALLLPEHVPYGQEWTALCSHWRSLDANARYVCVQTVGRALAAGGGWDSFEAGPQLLATLTQPTPAAARHKPDLLKVAVGASKLQLLFRPKDVHM